MLTKDYNQRLKNNTFYGITCWSEIPLFLTLNI